MQRYTSAPLVEFIIYNNNIKTSFLTNKDVTHTLESIKKTMMHPIQLLHFATTCYITTVKCTLHILQYYYSI